MSLTEKLEHDTILAMKAKEQEKLDALRMVRSAIKYEVIAVGHELSDDEVLKVLQKQIKQRKDASEQYRTADRTEQADKEDREARLIEAYLPAQLSNDELKHIVVDTIAELAAAGAADTGRVIGAVMKKVGSGADGGRVAQFVRAHLTQ